MTAHSKITKTVELCALIAEQHAYDYHTKRRYKRAHAAREIAQAIRDVLK